MQTGWKKSCRVPMFLVHLLQQIKVLDIKKLLFILITSVSSE